MSANPPVEKNPLPDEAKIDRAKRFLFGDDIFVSYSRPDGDYALALADELTTKHDLACFLDLWGTPPDEDLPEEVIETLNKSTMLVLVGTESAARSDNVKKEVVEFKKTGWPIIPITFVDQTEFSGITNNEAPQNLQGTLEQATWHKEIAGIAKTVESKARLRKIGEDPPGPSPHVITRIINAEGFISRSKRLRKTFWTTLGSMLAVLLVVGITVAALITKAYSQVEKAKAEQALAEQARTEAQAKSAEAQARLTTKEQELQTTSDKLSSEQEKLKTASDNLTIANVKTRQEQARAESARNEANRQARVASSRELAGRAISQITSDPEASVILAKKAYYSSPTREAARALRSSLLQSHVHNIVKSKDARVTDLDATGQYAIVERADGVVSVLRVADGQVLNSLPRSEELRRIASFSPDGKYVVISSVNDKIYTVFLWNWQVKGPTAET